MSAPAGLRAMTADDAAWAAGLMERRRQVYAGYSPVFWQPRPGITGLHARFLGRQIAAPGYVALRTGHAFLIGQRRDQEGFVDDFAVDETTRWDDDGAALLVLSAAPGSRWSDRVADLPGWTVASDWYLGRPG